VTLAKRIPGARLRHIADVGGSLLWHSAAAVVDEVLAYADHRPPP
jgi:hypothetical protein